MASARFLDPSSIPLKRQSGGNIWATLGQITQGVIIVILISGLMLFFLPVIQKTHHLNEYKDELMQRIAAGKADADEKTLEIWHMKNDPSYVERIARGKLNMGRPGETILRFDPYQPTPASAQKIMPDADDDSDGDSANP